MTFSCKNFDFNAENCMKLDSECIPGRPGCVLKGKVKFSEDIEKRLKELEAETASKKKSRG
jgi:hypothetical protein